MKQGKGKVLTDVVGSNGRTVTLFLRKAINYFLATKEGMFLNSVENNAVKEAKMSKYLSVFVAFMLAVSVWFASTVACQGATEEPVKVIKFANIVPLSGGGAPWGVSASRAFRDSAAELGVFKVAGKNYQFAVIDYDSKYNAADALSALNRAVYSENILYGQVMGAGILGACLSLINRTGFFNISMFAAGKLLTNPNYFTNFRLMPSSDQILIAFYEDIYRDFKIKRVALLGPHDDMGKSDAEVLQMLHKEKPIGTELVGIEYYQRDITSFYPILTKLLALKPDMINTSASPTASMGLIAKQARELGFKGYFYNPSAPVEAKPVLDIAGASADGILVPRVWANPPKKVEDLANRYKAKYKEDMINTYPEVYAAIPWIALAMQKAGVVDDTKLISRTIADIKYPNHPYGEAEWCGEKYFGIKRQVAYPLPLSIMKNGKYEQVKVKSSFIE